MVPAKNRNDTCETKKQKKQKKNKKKKKQNKTKTLGEYRCGTSQRLFEG